MKYTVEHHYYSYFGGAKHEYKHFNNLPEAWEFYKNTRANDFDYGDALQFTRFRAYRDDSVVIKPQRPHARSYEEWLKVKDTINIGVIPEGVTEVDVFLPWEEDLFPEDIDEELPF
jgi:hypothetical protein